MANGNRLNGKSKWLFGALASIAVFIGMLVTYGRTHGSESATVERLVTDVAAIQIHGQAVDNTLSEIAKQIAVIATDVSWIREDAENE